MNKYFYVVTVRVILKTFVQNFLRIYQTVLKKRVAYNKMGPKVPKNRPQQRRK